MEVLVASVHGQAGQGVVAAGHPVVAEVGARLLARGGNAVDAVVGALFASFHAEPILAGAAGAGFLVAEVGRQPVAWDFMSTAPGLGASPHPYTPPEGAFFGVDCDYGATVQVFHCGAGSVAVPGAAPGLVAAQQEAGRLPLAEVIDTAWSAVAEGTEVTRVSVVVSTLLSDIVWSTPASEALFTGPDGTLLRQGDRFYNPDLGHFFEALARHGASALRTGPIAEAMVAEVQAHGGGLTAQDLATYRPRRCTPVPGRMGDTLLHLAPPPSSGGMLVAYGAALLEAFDAPAPGSAAEVLLLRAVLAESLRARGAVIGADTPTEAHARAILDGAHVEAGRARVRALLERGVAALPPTSSPALGSTTHVSAIDRHGDAASATISVGETSGLVVPGYGLLLNNFLGEADLNPLGWHQWAPGARLGSSMTPMLMRAPDGAVTALGTGGANRIRTVLLQVARHLVVHGATTEAAVAADRLHYEDDTLYAEATDALAPAIDALAEAGTPLVRFDAPSMFFGGVHLAGRAADGRVHGVGDDRRAGQAALGGAPGRR